MKRILAPQFMNDLKEGMLFPILYLVKNDNTLDLQIRDNYINIYYRGGSLLLVRQNDQGYEVSFDRNYSKHRVNTYGLDINKHSHIENITNKDDSISVVKNIPFLKQTMDYYFVAVSTKSEREYQQLIVRENNAVTSSTTNGTDYYICDIEYADRDGRYDMTAVKWESDGNKRKNPNNLELSIIEVKYGDKALKGNSGIFDHLKKINSYLSGQSNIDNLKEEMMSSFNQKVQLGLINCSKEMLSFNNSNKIEFIFILINHDPASTILLDEIENIKIDNYPYIDIKFAVSNFMGYGLYKENIYSLNEFKSKYLTQICGGK